MKVRLLTDGGYNLDIDAVGKIYEATRSKYGYGVIVGDDGKVLYFYADEVEIVPEYLYLQEKKAEEDNSAIKIIVVSIIATILCIAAIIYVIF